MGGGTELENSESRLTTPLACSVHPNLVSVRGRPKFPPSRAKIRAKGFAERENFFGNLSVFHAAEADKKSLHVRYENLQCKINEEAAYDYNAAVVKQNLRGFRSWVESLTPEEKTRALQCMVKQITVLPDKLLMGVYELADFTKGSSNRSIWLQR